MKVRGLGSSLHDASSFTEIDIFIRSTDNLVAHIKIEIHIVEKLAANALIGVDIAAPEGWMIDLDAQKLVMPRCHGISSKSILNVTHSLKIFQSSPETNR